MNTSRTTLFLATALALAATATASAANDPRMDKLQACMKMPAATPEQKRCLDEFKAMPAPAAPAVAKSAAAPVPTLKSPQAAGVAATAKVPAQAPTAPVPPEVKAAAAQLGLAGKAAPTVVPTSAQQANTINSGVVGIASGIPARDISGMDLEAAMMAVQSNRAQLLEDQLKIQIEGVQGRNTEITKLNALLGDLKALRPPGTDPEKWANLGANQAAGRALYSRLQATGLQMPTGADEVNEPGTGIYDAKQKTFDVWNEQLKGKIDSLNSSQQMDMLRMQSLTNKRNEAFELMTNFIKKMQDSRSGIVGNMR